MLNRFSGLIVQIIVVVAGVLVFAFFDPFGILAPKKKTLEDTPISVASIQDIGQLVTAEYYGEVLSTLQDTLIAKVNKDDSIAEKEFTHLRQQYVVALTYFMQRKDSMKVRLFKRKKDLLDIFYKTNSNLVNNVYYQDMVTLILPKFGLDENDERDLLFKIWKSDGKQKMEDEIVKNCNVVSADFVKMKNKRLAEFKKTKAFRKRQIIALGRGWVKAGIDFGKFSEKNFKYDKGRKTIFLIGVEVSILDCDINPWFIPEQKVKGFEIIAATDRANSAKYLEMVKGSCLTKLRSQAITNGIIAAAKTNAEESLKNFFSLILDEPIDRVEIGKNVFEIRKLFPADTILHKEKLQLIDSALLRVNNVNKDSAYALAAIISGLSWRNETKTLRVHRYSAAGYRIAEDALLSPDEWKALSAEVKDSVYHKLDSLWFFPAKDFRRLSDSLWANFKAKDGSSPVSFWIDSITQKQQYVQMRKSFESALDSEVGATMLHRRESARKEYLKFLIERIKTIRPSREVSFNDSATVAKQLQQLN